MGGNDDDEAVPLVSVTKDFGETYAEIQAWEVLESDRYPDGVKYSMQYGTTDGETVIRYDNFPDHPGAASHHKHLSDGTVEDIQFPGLEELFDRFTEEVEPMANTGNPTDDDRTMYVRFQSGDEEGLREALRTLDRGETAEPHFEVVFDDPDDLHRVTRPKNLELLRTIAQHDPESIRETARLVDRDVRQVHTNLEELAELHLIDLERDGQRKRPTVWYNTIEVDLPLSTSNANRDDANA